MQRIHAENLDSLVVNLRRARYYFPSMRHPSLRVFARITPSAMVWCAVGALLILLWIGGWKILVRGVLDVAGAIVPHDGLGSTNLLLLGVGDKGHDGADLTDSMIILSIDPVVTRSAVLLSLPRDLLIETTSQVSQGRINAMYANEKRRLQVRQKMSEAQASSRALKEVGEEIGGKLGLPIHGVLKADFTAFTTLVDALGGVDVVVPHTIVDYAYPIAEDRVGVFRVEEGLQHFDGETALQYARSRHSTTDFDRSARQQQILGALAARARAASWSQRLQGLGVLRDRLPGHVETTLTRSQMLGFMQVLMLLSMDRIVTAQLTYHVGGDGIAAGPGGFVIPAPAELYEGASVLLPAPLNGGVADWRHIRTFVRFLTHHRSIYLQPARVALASAGARPIDLHRLRNELLRYGWLVAHENLPSMQQWSTGKVIYRSADHAESATVLGALLELPVERVGRMAEGADVIVLPGSEFTFVPFQRLSGSLLPVRSLSLP